MAKKKNFTVIHWAVKDKLKISLNEYVLLDLVTGLQNYPDSKFKGWCYATKQYLADRIGISKRSIINLINKLEDRRLLEKGGEGRLLRSTSSWMVQFYTHGEESSPQGEISSPDDGEESSPDAVKKVHPINKDIRTDNIIIVEEGLSSSEEVINYPFESDRFRAAWNDWKDYKFKKFKFSYVNLKSEQAALNAIERNATRGEDHAIAALEKTMLEGWKGFDFGFKHCQDLIDASEKKRAGKQGGFSSIRRK